MTRTERNLTALAVGILLGVWAGSTWATGGHYVPPVIVKTPVIVTPPPAPPPPVTPVVTPQVAAPPPASAVPPPAPTGDAGGTAGGGAGGKGPGLAGQIAFGFVGAFSWYVVCAAEIERNPTGFFARWFCFPRTGYRPPPTPEHMLPTFANP